MNSPKESKSIIIVSNIGDGKGRRIVKAFLDQLFENVAEQASKYMDQIDDAPYAYRELQLHSLLAPSIAKLTDVFLMEQPVTRNWSLKKKHSLDDSNGRLDYWCRYKKYDYFIELKHSYDAYNTNNIKTSTVERWDNMTSQLKKSKKEALKYSEHCNGVFLIAMQAITVYETANEPSSIENLERLLEIQKNYLYSEKFNPSPNWSALWIVPKKYITKTSVELDKSNEYYPALIIQARVSEVIQNE